MLDKISDFANECVKFVSLFKPRSRFSFPAERLFCPKCGDPRRINARPLYLPATDLRMGLNLAANIPEQLVDSLWHWSCVECGLAFTAVVYRSPNGPDLVVLPTAYGGVRTKNTPDSVAFYLDQAQRAKSVGAHSAAMAMYRSALEHLLFEQGFKDRMVGPKLGALQNAIEGKSAPAWAMTLDTSVLQLMKDLADGALHPNDGDVKKQENIDRELLDEVASMFLLLLNDVYEGGNRKAITAAWKAKINAIKK